MLQTLAAARGPADAALDHARRVWFVVTAAGQWTFVVFIVGFYFGPTFRGLFSAWNTKPLIDGHIPGDTAGNLMFAAHVVLAAVMTAAGPLQLVPRLRDRAPAFHRWNGRVFIATAALLASGGLILVWGRGTYLSLWAAIAISLDAVLILVFGALAVRAARRRAFDAHRVWALRTFMVVNGVWMLRVGYMFWALATGGMGMTKRMDGGFDLFWTFGCYLVPLAGLEVYLRARADGSPRGRWLVAGGVIMASLATFVGVIGALAFMWGPYL